GTGIAPFLVATAWTLSTLVGPSRREARAFAALLVALVPLLILEAASFDLRFTPGGFAQDRYVCYLAPLFAVGAAACLLERERRALRAGLVLAAGLAFLGLAAVDSFDEEIILWWASPAGAFNRAWRDGAGPIGLSAGDLLVVDHAAPPFRLVETAQLAAAWPLALVRMARPYRAAWLVTGAADGWARPGKPVRIRLFGGRHELSVSVRAPFEATRPQRF